MSLLTGPRFLRDHAGKIVEAFVYKGEVYYQFSDHFNLPTSRGLAALDYYEEFDMRCTKAFLTAHVAAVLDILNPAPGARLDLTRLAKLTKNLEERLTMLPVPDHIYKLAAVIFFTADEDPYSFDRIAAGKKIERWKKDSEILSFFLQQPLSALLPLSDMDKRSFLTFGEELAEKINEIHRSAVSFRSSVKPTILEM